MRYSIDDVMCSDLDCAPPFRRGAVHLANTPASQRTSDWQLLVEAKLALTPDCEVCGGAARTVVHVLPVELGGSAFDLANVRSVCECCHVRAMTAKAHAPVNASYFNG